MKHLVLGLWLLIPAAVATPSAGAPAPPPPPPTISETIDVRVVNVEAVVTDGRGKPVHGLSARDFRLLVDGKEVPIDYFTEVGEGRSLAPAAAPAPAGAAPAPAAAALAEPGAAIGRSYLVFIDEGFSVAGNRNTVLAKLKNDLPRLPAGDQMAVVAWSGAKLEMLCGWTADAAILASGAGLSPTAPTCTATSSIPPTGSVTPSIRST